VRRLIIIGIASALLLPAQTVSSTTTETTDVDINGRPVQNGPVTTKVTAGGRSETTETMQSVNGHMVPLEQVEERVVREDANGRVIERTVRRYDPNGNPTSPVRETVEEQKRPDGSLTTETTKYSADINGNMQVVQKSVVESRTSGAQIDTQTTIQRPTINGALETVEKQSDTAVRDAAGGYHEEALTYRRDTDGNFYTAVRKATEHTQQGQQATDNTAEYEVGPSGQLELHSQTLTKTTTETNGASHVVANVFGKEIPGSINPGGELKLQEQQITDRKAGPNKSMIETVSVRRANISDPNTLGPERQISQTVCRGDCKQ